MDSALTIPILPCRRLDEVVPFYTALGFELTYRQARPNPYAALRRADVNLHFFGLEDFDPANSLGSVIILVPGTLALYDAFAAGLRAARGALPIRGIPRITRPRRKQGTAGGFTVVDPGGNWLRIMSRSAVPAGISDDGTREVPDKPTAGSRLDRVLANAARQGDARGDERAAVAVLDAGLNRHADASTVERVPALVYLAELLVRVGDLERAEGTLAEVDALDLDEASRAAVATDLAAAAELKADLQSG